MAGPRIAQEGLRLPRVVVAVMEEEDNFPANLGLQAPGRPKLRYEEPLRKEPARLLAEGNHGEVHACLSSRVPNPMPAWIARLRPTQAAQPIRLYHR